MNDTPHRPTVAGWPSPARALGAAVDRWQLALAPLDAARRALWRLGCVFKISRDSVTDRSLRLTVLAVAHMTVAFTLAGVAPLWLLLLGPLVLGVPHIVSDLRYLVVRPPRPFAARARTAILLAMGAMTALRLAALAGAPILLDWELGLGGAAIAAGLALTPGRPALRAAAIAAVAALTAYGVTRPWESALFVGHLHNLVAFGYWLFLARDGGPWRRVALVAALYVAAVSAILAGAFDGLFTLAWSGDAAGLTLGELATSLAPQTVSPDVAVRLVTLFAFGQSVHYAVWLRLLPQRRSERQPPPSLARATRELRRDLGAWGLRAVVLATVLLPLTALGDARGARDVYLSLALFHGWLELAALSAFAVTRAPVKVSAP